MAEPGLYPAPSVCRSETATARFSEPIRPHILQLLSPLQCPRERWKTESARELYLDIMELIVFEVREYWEI